MRYITTMENKENITTFARSTVEDLFQLDPGELDRVMALDLPESAFRKAAKEHVEPETLSFKNCSAVNSRQGLSGLKPNIYLRRGLDEIDARASVARALWTLTREFYLDESMDLADLSAWSASNFSFNLRYANQNFFDFYGNDSTMLKIESQGTIVALATFTSLRKLVL